MSKLGCVVNHSQKRYFARHEGQSLPLIVLSLTALLGMSAVGVTVGTVYWSKTVLQNALDAGSRAGVQESFYNPSTTYSKAYQVVRLNDTNTQNLIIESGQKYDAAHPGGHYLPSAIVASAQQTVPGGFAGVFGIHQFHLATVSVAVGNEPFAYTIFQGCQVSSPGTGHTSNHIALHFTGQNTNLNSSLPVWVHANNFITGGASTLSGSWVTTASQTTSQISPTPRYSPPVSLPIWTLPSLQKKGYTAITQKNASQYGWTYNAGSGGYFTPTVCVKSRSCSVGGKFAVEGNVRFHNTVRTLNLNGGAVVAYGNIIFAGHTNIGQSGSPKWIVAAMPPSAITSSAINHNSTTCDNSISTINFDGTTSLINGSLYDPAGSIHLGGNSSELLNSSLVAYFLSLSGGMEISPPNSSAALPYNQILLIR